MATLAEMFAGAHERSYSQFLAKELVPTTSVNGVVTAWKLVRVWADYEEKVFRFEGLTDAQAHPTETSVNVTDASGHAYTVPLRAEIVDGSTGTALFASREVSIARGKMSPRMWWLEVSLTTGTLHTAEG